MAQWKGGSGAVRKLAAVVILVLAAGGLYYFSSRSGSAPQVSFTRVRREQLVSTLTTNGKVQPLESTEVRSLVEGPLRRIAVKQGDRVRKSQVLAEVDVPAAASELAAAESRRAQARAELERFERGGAPQALAEIDAALQKTSLELELAQRDAITLTRLVEKNAATRQQQLNAADRVRQLEQEMASLNAKRASLLPAGGKQAAEARLRDAETAIALVRRKMEDALIRSPFEGIVYNLAIRDGSFLRPGELIAEVGLLNSLRIIVYVDEPELGRVAPEMPVTITWDAAPGQSWTGTVQQMPARIVSLGTRNVGELPCRIDNAAGRLPAGANVNAEIRSNVVDNALTIPKEALRREEGKVGVLLLAGDRVQWREVEIGVSSLTRIQLLRGLAEGDAVALPSETTLRPGDQVQPSFQ
jgi:HlyD family secretion protein